MKKYLPIIGLALALYMVLQPFLTISVYAITETIGETTFGGGFVTGGIGNHLVINTKNPATQTGLIYYVQIRWDTAGGDATDVKLGTFSMSGNDATTRDWVSIGTVSGASPYVWNVTLTGNDRLQVEPGDYLGVSYSGGAGGPRANNVGGAGFWYNNTNDIELTGETMLFTANYKAEMYGTSLVGTAPTMSTLTASPVSYTSATLNGNITNTGGEDPTTRGFDWDTDSGIPYANNWTEAGVFGTGTFNHALTGLNPKTTYYYRSKATNLLGTGYGGEVSFTTSNPVQTDPANSFYTSETGIRFNGRILYATGYSIDNVGYVWDTNTHGDPGNIAPSTTVYPNYHTTSGSFGVQSFTYDASGLTAGTTYYYRAYIHTSTGLWLYGDELTEETYTSVLWYQPATIITGTTLPDRAGGAQNGIINFGTADLTGNMSFFAPPATPTPVTTSSWNITTPTPTGFLPTPTPTSDFRITPTPRAFPGRDIIDNIADSGSTPRQVPWMLITGFIILVASLTTSWAMRRFGSGNLWGKLGVIIGLMGIFVGLGIYDFWMILIFALIAVAVAMASRQPTWN